MPEENETLMVTFAACNEINDIFIIYLIISMANMQLYSCIIEGTISNYIHCHIFMDMLGVGTKTITIYHIPIQLIMISFYIYTSQYSAVYKFTCCCSADIDIQDSYYRWLAQPPSSSEKWDEIQIINSTTSISNI